MYQRRYYIYGIVGVTCLLSVFPLDRGQPPAAKSTETRAAADAPPQLVLETGGHQAIIRTLLFTADGRELVSVSDDKTIRIWSVSPDGQQAALARTLRGQIEAGRPGMLAAAALSPPDSTGRQRWLAVGGSLAGNPTERAAVRLHAYNSGAVQALLQGHADDVLALAFAPSGRWLASASKDKTIRLWDLSTLHEAQLTRTPLVLTVHADHIYSLAWSATGHRLAAGSNDHTVSLWDTTQLDQGTVSHVASLRGHTDQVRSVTFHPDGSALVSGGRDQTIRLWRSSDGNELRVFARVDHKVSALAFAPDGHLLLAGSEAPPRPDRLTLYGYPSGKVQRIFTGHNNTVLAMAFHPSGQWAASGGGDQKEILLWQVHTGGILSRLESRGQTVGAVGFSLDGRYLSWGHTAQYKSINDRGPLEHRFDLTQLARLSGGLSSGSAIRAQERVKQVTLTVESGGPYGYDYRLHITRGGTRLGTIERGGADGYGHSAYTLMPDGHTVLSGGLNGVLGLYNLDGTLRARLVGHTGEIKAVAVSADSRWAVSGSVDQTLKLWSLAGLSGSGSAEIAPTLTLFPSKGGEWVAWTPEGFFAASQRGAFLVGYTLNQGLDKLAQYVAVDQLYERFYRPDLLHTKLHGDPEKLWQQKGALTNAETVLASGLPPQINFLSPATDVTLDRSDVRVQVALTDQGGGMGKTVWKINGTTFAVHDATTRNAAPPPPPGNSSTATKTLQLTQSLTLLPGENILELVAYNQHNEVASPPGLLTLTLRELTPPPVSTPSSLPTPLPGTPALTPPTAPPPVVSTPASAPTPVPSTPALTPPTAPPASPPAERLAPAPAALYVLAVGVNRYRDKSLWLHFAVPDAQALTATLRQAAAPLFRDVHITPLIEEQVTQAGLEAAFAQMAAQVKPHDVFMLYLAGHGKTLDGRYYYLPHDFRYRNDDSIRTDAINQEQLQRWLASVPARKSLMLLDTCESGSFSQSLALLRGMSEKTAIDRLTRATGRATIVAAMDNQPALEGYEGHGVFTYVLLQALAQADASYGNHDGMTSIFELAAYVDEQVPTITKKIFNFEQFPQVHMVGSDFPIGTVVTPPVGKK